MFTIQYIKNDGVRALLQWPYSMVSQWVEKNKSMSSHVVKERSELWEDWAYDCGCNSGSPLRDAIV